MILETDPALEPAITWYSMGAYPVLERLDEGERRALTTAVSDFTCEVAPYRDKKGNFPRRDLPHFGEVSIIHAIAVAGAILIHGQAQVGYEEHAAAQSPILRACYNGWLMYRQAPTEATTRGHHARLF